MAVEKRFVMINIYSTNKDGKRRDEQRDIWRFFEALLAAGVGANEAGKAEGLSTQVIQTGLMWIESS